MANFDSFRLGDKTWKLKAKRKDDTESLVLKLQNISVNLFLRT